MGVHKKHWGLCVLEGDPYRLVAGVDEPKAFVGHAVHQRKGVVSRDDKYGVNTLGLEGSYYEVYALHLVCLRDGTVSLLRRKNQNRYFVL